MICFPISALVKGGLELKENQWLPTVHLMTNAYSTCPWSIPTFIVWGVRS